MQVHTVYIYNYIINSNHATLISYIIVMSSYYNIAAGEPNLAVSPTVAGSFLATSLAHAASDLSNSFASDSHPLFSAITSDKRFQTFLTQIITQSGLLLLPPVKQ